MSSTELAGTGRVAADDLYLIALDDINGRPLLQPHGLALAPTEAWGLATPGPFSGQPGRPWKPGVSVRSGLPAAAGIR